MAIPEKFNTLSRSLQKKQKMKKNILILLIITAITSMVFLFLVESFNDITCDDFKVAYKLQEESIWEFNMWVYFQNQGRFMGALLNSIQMKSYLFFGNMLPFSILLYVLNITLLTIALMNFFKLNVIYCILFAVVFFQLYLYSMFDLASYFWMVTKYYTLLMSLSLFAFSDLKFNNRLKWYDFAILFISFAFLGCSYEIYASIILLFMGCVLLYKLHKRKYNIKIIISENKKLVFSSAVCLIFFSLMVISPGNWHRMTIYTEVNSLSFSDYIFTVFKSGLLLMKVVFFRAHYFIAAGILLLAIFQQKKLSLKQNNSNIILKRILFYAFVAVGLCLVSIMLNTYATGYKMYLRAFNHINLIIFLFIGFSLYELAVFNLLKKMMAFALPFTFVFIIGCNLYTTIRSVPELIAYEESQNNRMEYLELLRANGNKETIKLEFLDIAEYHSVDDLWNLVFPNYTPFKLLKEQQLPNRIDHPYNLYFRKYYKLDFYVITDLPDDY